jgi:hypothetical protein
MKHRKKQKKRPYQSLDYTCHLNGYKKVKKKVHDIKKTITFVTEKL